MGSDDLSSLRIERDMHQSGAGRARHRRTRWAWVGAAAVAAAAVYLGFFHAGAVSVQVVSVSRAYPSQEHTLLNATGYVVAQRKAAVASKATGRLEWLGVREGSAVRAGEVVARLENRDVTAAMEQAAAGIRVAEANLDQGQAELREAERVLGRSRDLLAKKFVSQASHDAVVARHERAQAAIAGLRASVAVARANHRAAQVAVEQTLIRAPFDGIVLTKNANVGDVITPFSSALGSQAAVVTMADMTTLEVEADVSESNVGKVRAGQPCEIQLDALPETRFAGMVQSLVPTVDRAKATVTVKVRFSQADPRILPEMSAKVAFLSQEMPEELRAPRTVVPLAAVAERGGRTVVYVVKGDRAVETPLDAGGKIGDFIEVRSGVEPGERIVLKPPAALRDGTRVAQPAK